MNKNIITWITLITSLIGTAAWFQEPVFNLFRPCKIDGKILENYGTLGYVPDNNSLQTIYLLKLSVFSKNKDYFLKNINIYIKYPGKEEIQGKIWTWRTDNKTTFVFPDGRKKLKIGPSQYLNQFTILPKNISTIGYLSFSADNQEDKMFEYIKILFNDYKENKKELIFKQEDIKSNELLFDDQIWES